MRIDGLPGLTSHLKRLRAEAGRADVAVHVGYTQTYAVYVHEVPAHHVVGQDKYLETPARQLQPELGRIVALVFQKTRSMPQALLVAGLRLQRESQLMVPVDTSALKASAYTALEEDAGEAARAAFEKSEGIRRASRSVHRERT